MASDQQATQTMRPNILLITCHDLGRHLGCYGFDGVESGCLDGLARDGVLFENNFCTAPQCSPSRAALHTGRHAHTVGMLGLAHSPFNWRLHPQEKHMARLFQEAGYETALLGVQHLTRTRDVAALGYEHYDTTEPVVPAGRLAERAAAFLGSAERGKRPFYLEVGFFEPHRPYDWGGARPARLEGVELPEWIPESPEAIQEFAELHGMIRELDEALGRLLSTLDERSLAEDTWVIFVTDHGLAMPRAKCTLYDPGIAAALIMRWPGGGLTGGRRVGELTSHVDLLPTLLEGLELATPGDLHGRSYWPLLRGLPYQPREQVFAGKTYHTAYEPVRAIRTPTHKLIVNLEVDTLVNVPDDVRDGRIYPAMVRKTTGQRPQVELYDLQRDPLEMNNLSGQPDVAALEEQLLARLLEWMRETQDPLLAGPVASPYYHGAMARLREAAGASGEPGTVNAVTG